jgi:hypothetical protein
LASRTLSFFALWIRDTTLDLEGNAIGTRHTKAGGVASDLQNIRVIIVVRGEAWNQLGRLIYWKNKDLPFWRDKSFRMLVSIAVQYGGSRDRSKTQLLANVAMKNHDEVGWCPLMPRLMSRGQGSHGCLGSAKDSET